MGTVLGLALGVVVSASLFAGAAGLAALRERFYPPPAQTPAALYVTSGTALRRMAIGYAPLVADLYWIRAIQYFGDVRLGRNGGGNGKPGDYSLLYPLLDLTTTLDPRFNIAYRFGSIFLAEPFPGGVGRPDLAIGLLEKGLRAQPDKWEYVMDIGFVHYWWRNDYQQAASWFGRASKLPEAPWWLGSLEATTLAQGGDRVSSRQMWESIRETADNDWLRGSADRALLQLRALDEIDQLQAVVDRAVKERGTPARAGNVSLNGRLVADPSGIPYEVDASGRVRLGQKSSLFPLPAQPPRLTAPSR